jgi:hypothetical protein
MSIEVTMMFVASPKKRKVPCAACPQRQRMTSVKVWALGALSLSLAAFWAKRRIWMVAPAASVGEEERQLSHALLSLTDGERESDVDVHHQGPEIPNL